MIILDTCTVCEKNWDEAGLLFNCEECMGDHSYCQTHRLDHEHKIIENIEHVQIKPVYQENQNREELFLIEQFGICHSHGQVGMNGGIY